MFIILTTYAAISLSVLLVLAIMILRIGKILGECPDTGQAARSAAVTITTGYSAIGAGGVLLIASVLPVLARDAGVALIPALGLAVICLGLGFTHAIATLRAVVGEAKPKAVRRFEADTLEPTLA